MRTWDAARDPFWRAVPELLLFQIVSKGILLFAMTLLREVTGLLLWNMGRPAFSNWDLPFILRSWQGWCLVACSFLLLAVYTALDVNAMVLLSDRILKGEAVRPLPLLRTALRKISAYRRIFGLFALLVTSLGAPLAGSMFGLSLTSTFTVPEFIVTVIRRRALTYAIYLLMLVLLAVFVFFHLFFFHGAVLDGKDLRKAAADSIKLVRENRRRLFSRLLLFLLRWAALAAAVIVLIGLFPGWALRKAALPLYLYHAGIIFFTLLFCLAFILYALLFICFSWMKLTVLYYRLRGEKISICPPETSLRRLSETALLTLAVILAVSFAGASHFDRNFPGVDDEGIIAHRAGGTLGAENTVESLRKAVEIGADGAEIDVQRTKDDQLIVVHDRTFQRYCGVKKKPSDLTLEQVRKLRIADPRRPWQEGEPFATLDEMLDDAKGKIHLYIELKGESADLDMADDVVRMLREKDMLTEATIISLKYGLILNLEKRYPDVDTGYLCYYSFGMTEDLSCNIVLMEQGAATRANIRKIHAAGKKAGVWTVNSFNNMITYIGSGADVIITDQVKDAENVRKMISAHNDEARVIAAILGFLG